MADVPAAATRTLDEESGTAEFTARVTDFRELGRIDGLPLFQVALDRSAFTPECPTGILMARSRNGLALEAEVVAVERDSDGMLWHTTAKPLQPGVQVRGRLYAARPEAPNT